MPLRIKEKFYAEAVVVYMTAFYAIEFGVKSPCEGIVKHLNLKGKFYAVGRTLNHFPLEIW